jgi:hypothetical protein
MKKRAKLFSLDDDNIWIDVGVGWVTVEKDCIVMYFDEIENKESLCPFCHKLINKPKNYRIDGSLYYFVFSIFFFFFFF